MYYRVERHAVSGEQFAVENTTEWTPHRVAGPLHFDAADKMRYLVQEIKSYLDNQDDDDTITDAKWWGKQPIT